MEENQMCENCGKKEHCKCVIKGTYYCDLWQTEEKQMHLKSKKGEKFDFGRIE